MEELRQLPGPLLEWFGIHARVLPWRQTRDPYRIWVSEIMLQQTRVSAVLGYYRRFLEALPEVKALAEVPEDQLLKLWQGLGYYSRARNLRRAAQVLVEEYGGEFPREYARLRKLPGIGDYTAGAIGSIAFDLPVPAVDGNVLRVYARVTGDSGDILDPTVRRRAAQALEAVLPREAPGRFNQALMDLGAMVCIPNGRPLCRECPLSGFCRAHLEGHTEELPVKAAKKPRRIEERIVFLIRRGDALALRRRPSRGLLAGLWELPNEPAPALGAPGCWGFSFDVLRPAGEGKHIFTHIEWHMRAVELRVQSDALPPGWVWADPQALRDTYAVPNAFRAFLPKLET